jgi:Rho termination factor, N-terminal domain
MAKQQPGNQTAGTPDLSETELREMKVDELRRRAREEGVRGASSLRKEELVKAVSKAHRDGSGDRAETSSGRRSGQSGKAGQSGEAGQSGKAGQSGTTRQSGTGRAARTGRSGSTGGRAGEGEAGGPGDAGPRGGRLRKGSESSKSLKYSQEITSPDDEPERAGRSLATTNHEVIRQWAEARAGRPATVEGTEHGDRLGVLRFDFGDTTDRLRHVSWDQWFATFDERGLNFLYQEEHKDGRQSTFFRLENPEREDA